jgi:hypothetical protein
MLMTPVAALAVPVVGIAARLGDTGSLRSECKNGAAEGEKRS